MTTTEQPKPAAIGGPTRADDGGATFIELLISVVLLGIAGIAVLTALLGAVQGSRIHADISDAQSWLANTAEILIDEDSAFLDCAAQPDPLLIATNYQTVIVDPALASTAAPPIVVTDVEFWDSTLGLGGEFGSTCRHAAGDRLQLVTLETVVGSRTLELTVVKRPASIPPTVTFNPPPTTIGGAPVVPTPTPNL